MNKLFVLMGKSATGKDTIYKEILKQKEINLQTITPYTTRPIREGEQEGVEYHFVSVEQYEKMKQDKIVIEARDYDTIHGIWSYFTAEDSQFQGDGNYLMINTLEGYEKIVAYFGKEKVVPLYVEVEDGLRLSRALERERQQMQPKYAELCRRFLADSEDFSEVKLADLGIIKRYENIEMKECVEEILQNIKKEICNYSEGAIRKMPDVHNV